MGMPAPLLPNACRIRPNLRRLLPALAFAIASAFGLAASPPAAAAALDVGCLGPLWSHASDAFEAAHPEDTLVGGPGGGSRSECYSAQTRTPDLIFANVRDIVPGPEGETDRILVAPFNTLRLGRTPVAVDGTKFADLSSLATGSRELQAILSGVPPGLLHALSTGGKAWALPISVEFGVYAVRRDLFRAAGLELPDDWDWTTFLQDAEKSYSALATARPGDGHLLGMVLPTGDQTLFWEALFLGNSDRTVDQTGRGRFGSDANRQTLAALASWFRSGAVTSSRGTLFVRETGVTLPLAAFLNPEAISIKGVTLNADGDLVAGGAVMHPMPLPHGPRKPFAPLPAQTNAFLVTAGVSADAVPAAVDFLQSAVTTTAGVQYNGWLPADAKLGLAAYGPRVQRYYQWLNRALFPQGSVGAPWQRFAQRFADFAAGKLSPDEFAALLDATPNG